MGRRVTIAAALTFLIAAAAGAGSWRVGIARTDITPSKPTWMAGYASRTHPAEGTVHPLWAKALVFEDGVGNKGVIVAADMIGITRAIDDSVEAGRGGHSSR